MAPEIQAASGSTVTSGASIKEVSSSRLEHRAFGILGGGSSGGSGVNEGIISGVLAIYTSNKLIK